MELLVLIFHLVLALALIGVVLLQRSEGGALGIGGGGGMSGFLTGRSAANLLTRVTAVIAALFIGTSMLLAIMAGSDRGNADDVINAPRPTAPSAPSNPAPTSPAPSNTPTPAQPEQ